jgi:hypothetical protein
MRKINIFSNSFNMKKSITICMFLLIFGLPHAGLAQNGAPDPNDFLEDEFNPTDAPIDDNLLFILGAGMLFGFHVLRFKKNQKETL